MGIFGKSKEETALEQEVERLSGQNNLLLTLFDAWITRIETDYKNREQKDDGRQYMCWDGPTAGDVFAADQKLQDALSRAESRDQRVQVFAEWIPELVRLILMTSEYVCELGPEDQRRYQGIMAKVRMYFPSFRNFTNFSEVLIGGPQG